jgi:hypothetical protein
LVKGRRSPPSVRPGRQSTTRRTFISASGVRRIRTATSIHCSSCPPGRLRLLRPRLYLRRLRRLLRLLPRPPRPRPRLRRRRPLCRSLRHGCRLRLPRRPRQSRWAVHGRLLSKERRTRRASVGPFGRGRRRARSAGRDPASGRVSANESSLGRCGRSVHRLQATRRADGGPRAGFKYARAQAWIGGIACPPPAMPTSGQPGSRRGAGPPDCCC